MIIIFTALNDLRKVYYEQENTDVKIHKTWGLYTSKNKSLINIMNNMLGQVLGINHNT